MTTSTTYPNGQVLISSALTVAEINAAIQQFTYGMLGLPYTVADGKVRVDWPTEGQPFMKAANDVCFVSCLPVDVEYTRVRNVALTEDAGPPLVLTENWTFTKGWRVGWTFYGPNSEDAARQVRSALYMDYWNDQLNLANLFPVPDAPEPVRAPEEFNAQWFERCDYQIVMYENVTETINDGVATSVEVKVFDKDGQQADLTVTA